MLALCFTVFNVLEDTIFNLIQTTILTIRTSSFYRWETNTQWGRLAQSNILYNKWIQTWNISLFFIHSFNHSALVFICLSPKYIKNFSTAETSMHQYISAHRKLAKSICWINEQMNYSNNSKNNMRMAKKY